MTRRKQGFTLVELMLAMAFIAILLLAIAMLTMQISTVYNKGLTLRAVNEAGQLISSDMQRTLNTSTPQKIVRIPDQYSPDPTGARVCLDSVVYAWNYGKYLNDSAPFNTYADGRKDPVRLVKFPSAGVDYCTRSGGAYPKLPSQTRNLLLGGDVNLALHKLTIDEVEIDGDDTQRIYVISMIIGTSEASIIEGNGCRAPKSLVDDEYCAVNEFTFTARAGNKGGEE